MDDNPIPAAELAAKAHQGLSRYRHGPDTLTEIAGALEDVETTPDGDAWIVVRPVDGLNPHEFASATIPEPEPEIDLVLERVGRGGRITLVGMANVEKDNIARVRMMKVHTVNGAPVDRSRR